MSIKFETNIFDKTREDLYFNEEKLNIKQLIAKSGSQDPETAQNAQNILNKKWNLKPEQSALNAKTVDLMAQLETFSETDTKRIISQLESIQLTEGCNGNCNFCFLSTKKGVEAKFSLDSIKKFLNKYSELIPNDIIFYESSDPFDYKDGDHNFTDIYKAWKEIKPDYGLSITTSIPKGSQNDFIDFVKYDIKQQYYLNDEKNKNFALRISVSKQNFLRVEETFNLLFKELFNDGYSLDEIQTYTNLITINPLYNYVGIRNLGRLIKNHDDISDINSPAYTDGIVISPQKIIGIYLTVPTIYRPSGQEEILIDIHNTNCIPQKTSYAYNTGGVNNDNNLSIRNINQKYTMINVAKNDKGKEINLPNKIDNFVLKLGRESTSIGKLIKDFSSLTHINNPDTEIVKYVKVATEVYKKRRINTRKQISETKKYCRKNILPISESEKLEFYILLAEVSLTKMDFIADMVKAGKSLRTIEHVADTLKSIGKRNLSILQNSIDYLRITA